MKNKLHMCKGIQSGSVYSRIIFTFLVAIMCSTIIYAQGPSKTNKKEAEIKRLEAQLKTAKTNLARIEKQAHISDSLIETGTTASEDAENEFKELDGEQSKKEKEYASQTKPLYKKMGSKDKEVATEANKEFKEIDTKYKAESKELATKIKSTEKKSITAKANMDKGKAAKKTTAPQLKTAQTAVADLEQKIEALKSGDEATETTSKGKKK